MFGFGKSKVKGHLDVPEELYDAPFPEIIASVNPQYLEDAVIYCFNDILPHRKPEEYHFFRMYDSWAKMFVNRIEDILLSVDSIDGFKQIATHFPEVVSDVYEFILNEWIYKYDSQSAQIINGLSITDDVLIPMSDYERYQYTRFPIVREKALDILGEAKNMKELWDILQVFDQYFDMSRASFEIFLRDDVFIPFIDSFNYNDYVIEDDFCFDGDDIAALKEFFEDQEAYNEFMNDLPDLIKGSGLELYTLLIKVLGPNKEVIRLHDSCREFFPDE